MAERTPSDRGSPSPDDAGDSPPSSDPLELLAQSIDAAEEAIDSRTWLSTLMETLADGVVILKREGEITFANEAAAAILGWESGEITERTYDDDAWAITTPDGEPIADEDLPFRRVMTHGERIYDVEQAVVASDGTRRMISLNGDDEPGAGEDGDDGATRTVLYVEDDLSNLKLIERIFERRPGRFRLESAMQGRLGFELAKEHGPDLVLLDLNLPDMDGREVLARLHADERTRGIPVIVISADATPGRIERLLAAGARAYLTKPLDVRRFLTAVEDVLRVPAGPGAEDA